MGWKRATPPRSTGSIRKPFGSMSRVSASISSGKGAKSSSNRTPAATRMHCAPSCSDRRSGHCYSSAGCWYCMATACASATHASICVGDSGAGKSTLAAGFLKRGFEVLADDVVPVDDQGRAIAGFARIKLWQDTADRLGIDTAGLRRIMPDMDKYNLPIKGHGGQLTLPIRSIYMLESGPVGSISITPTSGMDRFPMLLANTYRGHFLDGTKMLKTHLQLCGKLASQAWVARVTRPTRASRSMRLSMR